MPAQQNLETDDVAGHRIVLILVVELEFVALDPLAHVHRKRTAVSSRIIHRRLIASNGIRAHGFGAVHGKIRLRQERLRRERIGGIAGNAHAGANQQFLPVPVDRLDDRIDEPRCERGSLQVKGQIGGKSDESVAAHACKELSLPQRFRHTLGNAMQDGIAGRMAVHVVDLLEPVEVKATERQFRCCRSCDGG